MPISQNLKVLAAFVAAGVIAATSSFLAAAPDASTVVTGCAIRFTTDGPRIHANPTHVCNGASSVRVLVNGDLEITQTKGGPIVSVTVEEDETLSTRGIVAGPSGGGGRTVVRFYATRSQVPVRADSPALQGSLSNIWVTWVHPAQ